jgi:hypothetical protein
MAAHSGLGGSQRVAGLFRCVCVIVRPSMHIEMTLRKECNVDDVRV